jgi:hypothetical protein
VRATPRYGDVTLAAYTPGARSLATRSRLLARSAHRGRATERIAIVNRSRVARAFFVALDVAGHKRLDAGYVLRVSR